MKVREGPEALSYTDVRRNERALTPSYTLSISIDIHGVCLA